MNEQIYSQKSENQIPALVKAFSNEPKTMLQVAYETGIERANICRHLARLRRQNRIVLVRYGVCPITKHMAGFYTTKNA